jgi:uncharacterized protein YjbJ (UPF0337 family)
MGSNSPPGEVLPDRCGDLLSTTAQMRALNNRRRTAVGTMDKLKDKAQALEGEGKKKVGDVTDNEQMQAEGKADQMKGDLKSAGEKVKDAF